MTVTQYRIELRKLTQAGDPMITRVVVTAATEADLQTEQAALVAAYGGTVSQIERLESGEVPDGVI